jgi:hypothetical protein
MDTKFSIDGVDVILEGEALTLYLAQKEKDLAEAEAQAQAKIQAETKRNAALAKLEALGLTTDDLRALGL